MLIRLLDVSGIFFPLWRYHEAKGSLPGLAAEETVKALRVRASATGADYVVACCDSGRSFRHAIGEEWRQADPNYRGYKANRSEKDAALLAALDRVISELEADGIPILRVPGFEADDIIATVTEWAAKEHTVEVVSDDKDLAVLVRDGVVTMVKRDGTVIMSADVRAKFGVEPEHVSEMLAIVGDTSDHVPGVKGIGLKQAPEVIYENGAYRGFLKAVEQARNEDMLISNGGAGDEYVQKFTPAMRRRLVEGERVFRMSLSMTTLRTDVPIDFDTVTAPRVPRPKPHSDTWKEQRERAASISAAIAKEEQVAMNETNVIDTPPSTPSVVKPPTVVDAPQPAQTSQASGASTALALPKQPQIVRGTRHFEVELEPRTYDEATLVAEHAADSKLFKDIGTPQQAIVLILLGRKFGLSAIDSLRMIHMIEGKPCMSAQLIVGIVQKSGFAEYFELDEATNTSATWITKRRSARKEKSWTFTVEDAKAARLGGLWDKEKKVLRDTFDPNSNWAKYSKVMCMWRAAVFLARAVYTDLVGGLYMPDEVGGPEGEIDGNPPVLGNMGQAA